MKVRISRKACASDVILREIKADKIVSFKKIFF